MVKIELKPKKGGGEERRIINRIDTVCSQETIP